MDAKPKAREMTLTVTKRIVETPDTTTLVFDTPHDMPPYKAGQFLTIDPKQFQALHTWSRFLEHVKGGRKELARAYSMSSAPHEPLAITVKEEPFIATQTPWPPLLSPFLTYGAHPGLQLQAVGFSGPYTLPPDIEERTQHVVHLVAGSGSVPNFAIVKASLREHRALRHTFLYSNKTWQDIAFRAELDALARAHPERLRVVHLLTREAHTTQLGENVRHGRLGMHVLHEFVAEPERCFFFVCGPAITSHERKIALSKNESPTPRFLETMLDLLEQLQVPKAHIKREAYG